MLVLLTCVISCGTTTNSAGNRRSSARSMSFASCLKKSGSRTLYCLTSQT